MFKACKLCADYIECNNANQNEVAYLHAYKIFVLFGDNLTKIDNHIKKFMYLSDKPVHDLLIYSIPSAHTLDMKGWRNFISTHPKAILYFQQAPIIENVLKRAPKDVAEAETILSKIKFKRANENSTLAKLCIEYKCSEEIFNKCLEIKPKQKVSVHHYRG